MRPTSQASRRQRLRTFGIESLLAPSGAELALGSQPSPLLAPEPVAPAVAVAEEDEVVFQERYAHDGVEATVTVRGDMMIQLVINDVPMDPDHAVEVMLLLGEAIRHTR